MATVAQINANRLNAQLSTGPTSEEGKARVSKNALRHGFTSREIVILPGEQHDFDALSSSLHDEVFPQGPIEEALFEQLLHAAWNLRRARALEAAEFEIDIGKVLKQTQKPLAEDTDAALYRSHNALEDSLAAQFGPEAWAQALKETGIEA
jgi:hypothetical protein